MGNTEGVSATGVCFRKGYANSGVVLFLVKLFIVLWSLLLVIPGIIKADQYRMVPYILSDQPDLNCKEVFTLVLLFWTEPCYKSSCGRLYEELRGGKPGKAEL